MTTMASQITSVTVVYQSFIQTQIKENIKAPRHWPLCGEFTGDRWIPRTNGQLRGKCFHLMTSSWIARTGPVLPQPLRRRPSFRVSPSSFPPARFRSSSKLLLWKLWDKNEMQLRIHRQFLTNQPISFFLEISTYQMGVPGNVATWLHRFRCLITQRYSISEWKHYSRPQKLAPQNI